MLKIENQQSAKTKQNFIQICWNFAIEEHDLNGWVNYNLSKAFDFSNKVLIQ